MGSSRQRIFRFSTLFVGSALLVSCASSPMKARLDRNFVYNCSLELIGKDVPPADAERICTSSHNAELAEDKKGRSTEPAAAEAAPAPQRAPAAEAAPKESPALAAPAAPAPTEIK